MSEKIFLYVGTYTRSSLGLTAHNGEGIYVYEFDASTGKITYVSEMQGIDNPSFLAISPDGNHLYATSEVLSWQEGLVSAYAIDRSTGKLTYLNKQSTRGSITAHISVEASGRYALLANYWDGHSVAMFPINGDGSLAPASFSVEHDEPGTMVDPARQEKSHAHCIMPDLSNQYALVPDLGLDKIMIYRLDLDNGKLVPNDPAFVKLNPGSGPRHAAVHPNGKYVYVIEELSSTISLLNYDGTTGALDLVETVSTLPEGYNEESYCSEICVTASGKYLYGANRGHDSLSMFAVDASTGKLTPLGHQSTGGQTPRNFTIDPTGNYILVGNQNSDTVVTLRINHETGILEDIGQVADVPTPAVLRMLRVNG